MASAIINLVTSNVKEPGTMQLTMKVSERKESASDGITVMLRPVAEEARFYNYLSLTQDAFPEIADWRLGGVFVVTIEKRAALPAQEPLTAEQTETVEAYLAQKAAQ
jgi:hypothetical protein